MKQTRLIVHDGVVVPESALLRREKVNIYGSVPGLPDEELADPDELERQVYMEEFGPVLALPVRSKRWSIQPAVDESGDVDWGAFGTVDFERTTPQFDKARYKAEKLRDERKDVLRTLDMIKRRLPGRAKYKVLKYVRQGILDLGDIANHDMYQLAVLDLRVGRLTQEIATLEEAGRQRKRRAVVAMFGT